MTIINIGNRDYISTLPLNEAFTFDPQQNYCFELQNTGCLQIEGVRARDFLQGQLTCDILKVTHTQMRTGGLCNLKGRLLALMDVILDNDTWNLILPRDLIQPTQTSMTPFAMVSRCQLKTSEFKVFGLFFQNLATMPDNLMIPTENQSVTATQDIIIYRINESLALMIIKQDAALKSILNPFITQNTLRESLGWHYLQLKHQRFALYTTTRGLFLPHRLGLHKTNIISFDKGCYKGQEIIARMHYKSTVKHQLCFFEYATNEPMNPGETLRNAETQEEIGELIDFTPLTQPGKFCVAILRAGTI